MGFEQLSNDPLPPLFSLLSLWEDNANLFGMNGRKEYLASLSAHNLQAWLPYCVELRDMPSVLEHIEG